VVMISAGSNSRSPRNCRLRQCQARHCALSWQMLGVSTSSSMCSTQKTYDAAPEKWLAAVCTGTSQSMSCSGEVEPQQPNRPASTYAEVCQCSLQTTRRQRLMCHFGTGPALQVKSCRQLHGGF
jgi:hypothetical protein